MKLIELMDEEEIRAGIDATAERGVTAIHNDEEADEALSKMLWAKAKIEENNKIVKEKAEQLKAQLEDYRKRLNGGLEYYLENRQHDLEIYLNSKLQGRKGSLKLFHGTASLKEDPGRTTVDDEASLITWLKKNGHAGCISTKESVSKTEVKKTFRKDPSGRYFLDEDGNVIEGVHIDKEEGLQLKISLPRLQTEDAKGAA